MVQDTAILKIADWAVDWCHFKWLWMTPYTDFKGMPLFDVEYLTTVTALVFKAVVWRCLRRMIVSVGSKLLRGHRRCQSINQSTKWRMQALKCLYIRVLNVNTTSNSNQYQLWPLIDLRFRQRQLCNQTWNLDMTYQLPRRFLNTSIESTLTTKSGKLFRIVIILGTKAYFLMSR